MLTRVEIAMPIIPTRRLTPLALILLVASMALSGAIVAVRPIVTVGAQQEGQQTVPLSVAHALREALNAHDVEATLALFADDAVVKLVPPDPRLNQPPSGVYAGKEEIRKWAQLAVADNITIAGGKRQVAGNTVTTSGIKVSRVPAPFPITTTVEIVVEQGKIKSLTSTWHFVMIDIAQTALDYAVSLRDMAKTKGENVTRISEQISRGEALLKEARESLVKKEFSSVLEKSKEAMKSVTVAVKASGGSLDKSELDKQGARGLLDGIARNRESLKRLTDHLRNPPANAPQKLVEAVASVKQHIDVAQNSLDEAEKAIKASPPNVQAAAKSLAAAKNETADAYKAMKDIATGIVPQMIGEFIGKLEKQVETIRERLASRTGTVVQELKIKLNNVDEQLKAAKAAAEAGKIKEAQKILKDAKTLLQSIVTELQKLPRQIPKTGRGR